MNMYSGDDSLSALLHPGVALCFTSRDIPITPSLSVNDFMRVLCKVVETMNLVHQPLDLGLS
jgi:hypothetical protein